MVSLNQQNSTNPWVGGVPNKNIKLNVQTAKQIRDMMSTEML
jgi:hypothetical protein